MAVQHETFAKKFNFLQRKSNLRFKEQLDTIDKHREDRTLINKKELESDIQFIASCILRNNDLLRKKPCFQRDKQERFICKKRGTDRSCLSIDSDGITTRILKRYYQYKSWVEFSFLECKEFDQLYGHIFGESFCKMLNEIKDKIKIYEDYVIQKWFSESKTTYDRAIQVPKTLQVFNNDVDFMAYTCHPDNNIFAKKTRIRKVVANINKEKRRYYQEQKLDIHIGFFTYENDELREVERDEVNFFLFTLNSHRDRYFNKALKAVIRFLDKEVNKKKEILRKIYLIIEKYNYAQYLSLKSI